VIAGIAAICLATLPVWLPWVLKPVLGHLGFRFEKYERRGYAGFVVTGLEGAWDTTRLEAGRVEGALPTAWLWRTSSTNSNPAPLLTMEDWRVFESAATNAATSTPASAGPEPSLKSTLDDLGRIVPPLKTILPAAVARGGVIEIDSNRFGIPLAEWRRGQLQAQMTVPSVPGQFAILASFGDGSNASVSATWDRQDAAVHAKLHRDAAAWRLDGQAEWGTNRAVLSAITSAVGWWPAQAQLLARSTRLPAGDWRPKQYLDPVLTLNVNIVSNRFELEATGTAEPTAAETWVQPRIQAVLRASGNPEFALVHELGVQAGCLNLALTNPVGLRLQEPGGFLTNQAWVQLGLDLAKARGLSLTGRIDGAVQLQLSDWKRAAGAFQIESGRIHGADIDVARSSLTGALAWPLLRVERAEIELADGSTLYASAAADLAAREVTTGKWQFAARGPRTDSSDLRYEGLTGSGTIAGPFTNLAHSGEARVAKAEIIRGKSWRVSAAWQGTNLHLTKTTLDLTAASSRLALEGEMRLRATGVPESRLTLSQIVFERQGHTLYSLARPVSLRWQGTLGQGPGTNWTMSMDPLDWNGTGHRITVQSQITWPSQGEAKAEMQGVALSDFADFLPATVTNISLRAVKGEGSWSNGPVRAALSADATLQMLDGPTMDARGTLRSGDAVEVDQLTLSTRGVPALTLKGTLPFALVPGQTNRWLRANQERPLELQANLETVESFSWPMGAGGELHLSTPKLQMTASGTLAMPKVVLAAGPSGIEWRGGTNASLTPRVEQVQFEAVVTEERLELRKLEGKLEGQAFHADGEWPLPAQFWTRLPVPGAALDWNSARGHLAIEHAQLATLSRYAPAWLTREGQVDVDLALRPGRTLEGLILLTNAATRAAGELSAARDLSARIQISGDEATLTEFRGQVGGQPIRATGRARLLGGGGLEYQLNLQGSNVPLARTVEFLVRGDFDLEVKSAGRAAPAVSGTVRLHDGLFAQHASALLLSSPDRPAVRPPYFSVTNEPFGDWTMDVAVRGDEFLRVRTPVFTGILSLNVKLGGTLREPVLVGDARVNSGRLIFPFGTLRVDQASASLGRDNPRGPELFVHASGRNYRYEIRLEVTGPAERATVLFSSTPPLTSEEILLMLTAGELPKNEAVFSTTARAGQLATFLGRDVVARFSGGDVSSERLIINTTENITEEGRTTYSIEYRLTDRWSLVGEYDRFSALNAAVKWRILSR